MSDTFEPFIRSVPVFEPVPPASGPDAIVYGFQHPWFELSIALAAVLLNIAVAIEFLTFLDHARHHENDLRPLAWVRYVILGFNVVFGGDINREMVPAISRFVRISITIPLLAMYGSLAYYDFIFSDLGSDSWMYFGLHSFGAMFLLIGFAAALFPVVVGPIVYIHTLGRALFE
jgi:hypothetical protein